MLLIAAEVQQNTIFYESIFPAVLAAIVTILGIIVQLLVGIRGNSLVIKSIIKTKKIESYMQFYKPLDMLLNEITIFFESHMEFNFDKKQYQNIDYCAKLKELQVIYSKICNWYRENYSNMYPEDKELDELISKIYNHMMIILRVDITIPESWDILSRYNKKNIILLIDNIKTKVNEIAYQ